MAPSRATQQKNPSWQTWITISLLLALCNQAHANGKVYQVELIVFERTGRAAETGESWQKNIPLEYPEKWQRLLNPAEKIESHMDSPPASGDFLQDLAQEREQSQQVTVQPNTEAGYFTYLPPEKRGLQHSRNALARRNQYRILFHETWLQPVTAIEKATPLILHGGRQYGDYYELQGTLTVGANRFLHVQTDFWLSEFSSSDPHHTIYGVQLTLPREPRNQPIQADREWENEPIDPFEELSTPDYQVNQVIVLRQKRRMRSGELHYLDHPRLSALIKIIPQ
jgi:hypothetical protein